MNTTTIVWKLFEPLKYIYSHNKTIAENPIIDYDMLDAYFEKFGEVYDPRTKNNYLRCMLKNGWLTEVISEDPKQAVKQHLGLDKENRQFRINLKAKKLTQTQKLEQFKQQILGKTETND